MWQGALTHMNLLSWESVGSKERYELFTKTNTACSEESASRLRKTYTSCPMVMSLGIKNLFLPVPPTRLN